MAEDCHELIQVEKVDELQDAVKILLNRSVVPRSSIWIRRRLGWSPFVGAALRRLAMEGEIDYLLAGQWEIRQEKTLMSKQAFDPMSLVGPVWEPRVVEALRAKGVSLEQQKHVLSYFLDISIENKNGMKINIEVDGRSHRTFDGRRRLADLIRDARLRAEGWTVIRVWVKDLAADFDGAITSLISRISEMEGA